MAKIPFKVSARTARLIGRESIASSKGAIIELVKNGYDADSPLSLIYFHPKKDCLYIIDSGDGMTQSVIEQHWMTIGTDNKVNDIFTKTGRVKAGAKGIGRFALDKLGDCCTMTTKPKNKEKASVWCVDWRDFEGDFKTIDSITADLSTQENLDLKQYLLDEILDKQVQKIINQYFFEHGTVLKISNLRDNWDDYFVAQVFNDLEVLSPPKEQNSFKLFLYNHEKPNEYGEILGSICDDYDYKLVAKADEHQNVKIKIFRNEYDVETISPEFFKRNFAKCYPYTEDDFKKGEWTKDITFSKLLPGFKDIDKDNIFEKIGGFEFSFYFMKRAFSTPDLNKFHYNKFNANERKDWLNKFGGIKVFRDDFRVRPYGETKDSAFDWLGLGGRKAKSPATPSKPGGGWKVAPDNIAGGINITRLGNLEFEDKSSREGLQENKSFQIFKQIILQILNIIEVDRAVIAKEMKLFYNDVHADDKVKEDADKLAKRILENARKNNQDGNQDGGETNQEKVILSRRIEEKDEEIEAMESEQKILRGMATSAIVTASFSHELGNLSDILLSRTDELVELLKNKNPQDIYQDVEDFLNPYLLIEDMKKQDAKLQSWLKFSLASAKKDKRRRRKVLLNNYFQNFKSTWKSVISNRMIDFSYDIDNNELDIRAMEIDLDSIFNNLLVNSIDSFIRQKNNNKRKVKLKISNTNKEIIIDYFDNGKGLSQDIREHSDIFKALYTTKRNEHTGEEIGTGLGMWLVNTIVKEYNGGVKLLYPENKGFGIRISFIRKYKRK
ncbi:putative two-component system sensor histidine kinase, putative heat shock protein [uncultured Candidatus Thioglobus sp.]|nr:putative two-component system sensor histidine kinase, putative heat shock protein [uncultured Candidatus Thioglobus sp.]